MPPRMILELSLSFTQCSLTLRSLGSGGGLEGTAYIGLGLKTVTGGLCAANGEAAVWAGLELKAGTGGNFPKAGGCCQFCFPPSKAPFLVFVLVCLLVKRCLGRGERRASRSSTLKMSSAGLSI